MIGWIIRPELRGEQVKTASRKNDKITFDKKWSLPLDYPMVAANYSKARSELAKAIGLGQTRKGKKAGKKRPKAKAKVLSE